MLQLQATLQLRENKELMIFLYNIKFESVKEIFSISNGKYMQTDSNFIASKLLIHIGR